MNPWLKALEQVRARQADKIPPGWLSVREVAKAFGVDPKGAFKRLRPLLAAKRVEKKYFLQVTGNGLRRVPFYRLVG